MLVDGLSVLKPDLIALQEVRIPENTTSLIHIPRSSSPTFAIYANDQLIWSEGRAWKVNKKISFDSRSDREVVVECRAGSYDLRAFSEE